MNGRQKNEFEEMELLEKKIFIIEYNKASQLDRSFAKSESVTPDIIRAFRENLLNACLRLMRLVERDELTNQMIRDEIRNLIDEGRNISFGQAQKVVNVVLKQYCFLLKKRNLYQELDCPLDSTTMGSRHTLKELTEEQYLEYQERFERENNGIRILADRVYDERREARFLQ